MMHIENIKDYKIFKHKNGLLNIFKPHAILLLIVFFIKSISSVLFAQQANIWYFHQKAGLDFSTSPPTVLTNGAIITPTSSPGMEGEGVASICDNSGSLLFYTDGVTVYNKSHAAMTNGTGLLGHPSSAQSAIIIPKPGSTTNYYIVTAPLTNTTNGIRYNEVDMTLNSGNGDVITTKKNILISSAVRMMEAVCAVPHSNGTDYWLLTHTGAGSNAYNIFLVTSGGITLSSSPSIGYTVPSSGSDIGLMKANSCYNKIALAFHPSDVVDVLDFNNTTGTLANAKTLSNFTAGDGVYGLEFSTNGQFLYVTGLYNKILYQFDISSGVAATMDASRVIIGYAAAGADRLAALQLGPDGKIYAANHSWGPYNDNAGTYTYLGVINSPNSAGTSCNWVNNAIAIPSVQGPSGVYSGVKHGLPTILKSFVSSTATINADNLCVNQNTPFSYTFSGVKSGSVSWDFGDGNTSNLDNPSHSYSAAGTYTVKITITDICSSTITRTKSINVINAKPSVNWTCSGNTITLNGTSPGTGNTGYMWFGGSGLNTFLSNNSSYVYSPATLPASFMVYGTSSTINTSYANYGTGYPQPNPSVTFDAASAFTIKTIDVKPELSAAGCSGTLTANFTLKQGAVTIGTKAVTINCSGGAQTVTLNLGGPAGSGYSLQSDIGFYYVASWESGTYPWRNSSIISYTGTNNGTYGPFSNWVVSTPSSCSSLQVDINSGNCSLPVKFLTFDAVAQDQTVLLNWITTEEINSDFFIIEKSYDGVQFEEIGKARSKNNYHETNDYSFTDYNPTGEMVYYRIKEVDKNNQYTYSTIEIVNMKNHDFHIYPNPAENTIVIQGNESIIGINIINELGQIILSISYDSGIKNTYIDLNDFSSGVYHLSIITPGGCFVKKIVKVSSKL